MIFLRVLDFFAEVLYNTVRSYDYDAFGKQKDDSDSFYRNQYGAAIDDNPFRYCSEYFDDETGLIYLRARYYDPDVQRFVAEDTHWNPNNMIYGDNRVETMTYSDALDVFYSSACYPYMPSIVQSSNGFVYAGNAPLTITDANGQFWDTIFDVVSLVSSVVDVVKNPKNPRAWIGLAGDVIDLVPGVTGVGETVRAVNTGRKICKHINNGVSAASDVAKIGADFGKLGKLVVNDGKQIIDWTKTTRHGLERMAERKITNEMVETWVRTGKALQQTGDKILYVTKQGAAVVNKQGQVITAYTTYDSAMQKVVKELFG